ncbi:uncharacterized protein MELLADRAFT_104115 [Melampsora larici-populina 98AG31]|uniref:PX domain-containing protein n=1 Tax=Melampsora larici-populina (strain 98AG31 / pathotype 3-4-7) TaxID=747676 RepID=F4RDM0_MELLP|nr:uncharacterized protein MELLADRAFT_104115 [Melampsora larici-populina 98AG31]EGG09584.1 hypothetical protein MELLADRAFT_104115 [Melampsora larici-populina 98AG31]
MDPLNSNSFNQPQPHLSVLVSHHHHHPITPTHLNTNQNWPTSPFSKPNSINPPSQSQSQSIIWPNRSKSPPSLSPSNHQISNQSLYHQTHSSLSPTSATSTSQRFHSTSQISREPRSPTREENRRPSLIDQSLTTSSNPNQNPNSSSNQIQVKSKEPSTRIRVSNVERNRRDLYIKFDAWSNLITNRSGHCSNISRSYREFLLFYESISANNPHTIVPPIPFPNTSAPNPADDDRLVASAFQQFFDRLLQDQSLRTDDELRIFLESDFGYTPQTRSKRKLTSHPSGGFGSFNPLSSHHKSPTSSNLPTGRALSSTNVNGITGKPEMIVSIVEEDELSNARLQFRLLEDRLGSVVSKVESLARVTRTLSSAHQDLSTKFISFSTTESHPSLSNGFKKLADGLRNLSVAETGLAIGSLVTLADGFGWCSVESKAGKEVLKNRASLLDEHYSAVKKSIEKRRNIERIKSSTGQVVSERVELALDELEEAKKLEEQLSEKATMISNNLRPALRTHSKQLHDDLLFSLIENSRTQLIYETSILKEFTKLKSIVDSIGLKPLEIKYESKDRVTSLDEDRIEESMIHQTLVDKNQQSASHQRHGSRNANQQRYRVNFMAQGIRTLRNGDDEFGSKVDAKSAAASLARLF